MPALHITPIPAFNDNYIWVIANAANEVVVVDPGDAAPVEQWLAAEGAALRAILITHHHGDHIGGLPRLRALYPDIPVYGPAGDHIAQITHPVGDNDVLDVLGHQTQVLAIPGHTLDHLAYLFADAAVAGTGTRTPLLFCGDTLFAAGCGRLFEGSPDMMYTSLQRLASLPAATKVYCAHEYTLSNLRFALAAEPDNEALGARLEQEQHKRNQGIPTLPTTILLEQRTNPFLRCHSDSLRQMVSSWATAKNLPSPATDRETFALLRRWKDEA